MRYLSKHEILDLHAFVLERYGGKMGIKSQDQLNTVLLAPQQVMFGEDLYPDIPSKGAALVFSLLKSRPFASGNEATALFSLLRFLELNRVTLAQNIGDSEIAATIRGIGRSQIDKDALEAWLRKHIIPAE